MSFGTTPARQMSCFVPFYPDLSRELVLIFLLPGAAVIASVLPRQHVAYILTVAGKE